VEIIEIAAVVMDADVKNVAGSIVTIAVKKKATAE